MNKDKLLVGAIIILLIVGVVCICLSMMHEDKSSNYPLPIALACVFVANSLIVLRNRRNRRS